MANSEKRACTHKKYAPTRNSGVRLTTSVYDNQEHKIIVV